MQSRTSGPKCIIIAGPTSSGKSSLSVELALAMDGKILNADSMQVYRGMDIGTAKPTPEEQKGIPHLLLNVVNPDEAFNAAIYRSMALPLVTEVVSDGKTCFVTGGTGLYIKSLTKGLFPCPPADPEFRESLRIECEARGTMALYEKLKLLDPESADRTHPNDKFRILRALEIAHLTKRRPSELFNEHGFSDTPLNTLKICLEVERELLYRRINERTVAMVETGLPEETENLLAKGYSPDLKPMKSIGYRHMVNYLRGEWSLEETIYTIQRDTRRYAKRQLTWFRADQEYVWIKPEDFDIILAKAKAFLFENA
ncbi:MAG: tRNA (adenosine(37)-N6)-dimethylallyltransferase MiaA [Deltaproteobacteria bacterium]|nr:tRNA (adenosine(37)-N6)-dimethylallyltransferase MiaA [Deltaproteobacteria bacterium]